MRTVLFSLLIACGSLFAQSKLQYTGMIEHWKGDLVVLYDEANTYSVTAGQSGILYQETANPAAPWVAVYTVKVEKTMGPSLYMHTQKQLSLTDANGNPMPEPVKGGKIRFIHD